MADKRYSKYFAQIKEPESQQSIPLGPVGGVPIKANIDGSIEAEKFIMKGANGESCLQEFVPQQHNQVEGFYVEKEIDSSTNVKYIPSDIEKCYTTSVNTSCSLVNQFAKVRGKVYQFDFENLDRFVHADRYLKAGIKKLRKTKNKFYFTDKKFNTHINKPYIDSTTFGPYNYDTKIKVTKDLEFINDLLVIRTGIFHQVTLPNGAASVPSGENICFISPHEFLAHTGTSDYITTGVRFDYVYNTGVDGEATDIWTVKYDGLTNQVENYGITSKYVRIAKDSTLRTNIFYEKAQFDGTESTTTYTNQLVPSSTTFNSFLVREKSNDGRHQRAHNVNSSSWDGVIPAGAFIKIETWSTNPDYIGFDGELAIVPVNEDVTCEFSYTAAGIGVDKSYSVSVLKAVKSSYKKLYRKINNYLISKGIKSKNSGQKSYENMVTKNAQNIYEGLSYIRNESVQKQRGLEFSPLDSPYYFDGSYQIYGGSKLNSNYNYSNIVTDLKASINSSVSPYTNSSTSSTGY